MTFKISQKSYFITYPQCGELTKERVLQFFTLLGAEKYAICRELHQDGNPHIHALIVFEKKFNSRSSSIFDIDGKHGKIEPLKSQPKALEYVKKDGDFITNIEEEKKKRKYNQIIKECSKKKEFMEAVLEEHPRDYVINLEKVEYFANKHFKKETPQYQSKYTAEDFEVSCPHMKMWADQIGRNLDRPFTLILCGPSRTGKTQWARSLGPHIYFNGMFNLDKWNDEAGFIVFDDYNIDYLINYKQWFGGQEEIEVTDKYRKKVTINKDGMHMISICNEPEDLRKNPEIDKEWLKFNSKFTLVQNALLKRNKS